MTFSDEELLNALTEWIIARSGSAKNSVIEVLAKYLTVAYDIGGDTAGAEIGIKTQVSLDGLDNVIDKLGPVLDETFGNLSKELTDIIDQGIKNNLTYKEVRAQLIEKLNAGWGTTVSFTRAGQVRKYIDIAPNGSMQWNTRTITRNVTMNIETYANTLARSNIKAAWAEGHRQKYKESGYKGWVFMSVADERTRPHHLALHGKVFIFGTDEEAMALDVMKEPNCRCRPKAWFDDPDLDTPEETYIKERTTWAKKILGDFPEDSENARFLQQLIQQATA